MQSTCATAERAPRSRGVHSTSKSYICPEGLHPQRDLNKKKTSLTFNTQGEFTESAVKRKISLQVCGEILFSNSMEVNKHSTLGCCFPKNSSSGERGSDSQALKEGPGTERGFRQRELSSSHVPHQEQGFWQAAPPALVLLGAFGSTRADTVLVTLQDLEFLDFLLNSHLISFTLSLFHTKFCIWGSSWPGLAGKQ